MDEILTIKTFIMKKIIIAASMLVCVLSSFASGKEPGSKIREWAIPMGYHSVYVSDDIELVLVEDIASTISIQGVEKYVDNVSLEVRNGELRITSKNDYNKNKVVIYVPVQKLTKLTVVGNSTISSMGVLDTRKLNLRVEGLCKIKLKTNGEINVETNEHYDFNMKRIRA